MTLILNNDEVRRLLTMDACLEILEDAYREQAAGRAMNQLPTTRRCRFPKCAMMDATSSRRW